MHKPYISTTQIMFNRGFSKLHFQTCYANACVFIPDAARVEKHSFQCY